MGMNDLWQDAPARNERKRRRSSSGELLLSLALACALTVASSKARPAWVGHLLPCGLQRFPPRRQARTLGRMVLRSPGPEGNMPGKNTAEPPRELIQDIMDLPLDLWMQCQRLWKMLISIGSMDADTRRFVNSRLGAMRTQFHDLLVEIRLGRRLPVVAKTVAVLPHRIKRDIEQFEYLVSKGVLEPSVREYVVTVVIPDYRRALVDTTTMLSSLGEPGKVFLKYDPQYSSFFCLHCRPLHLHQGEAVRGEALAERDFEGTQDQFFQKKHRSLVMDDFLSAEALQQLRDFLLESTFWFDTKPGFVGTYLHTGFASPLVAQIDHELRSKLPRVLHDLELQTAWAFMYDGSLGGINTHADDAQVQVNIFITPTEANLWSDDSSEPAGGMVIFGVGPPSSWEAVDFNTDRRALEIEELIKSTGNWKVTIPYVQNRAVLFDSTYFHKTDNIAFKPGYKNRRINVTFLYGKRKKLTPAIVVCTDGVK